MAYTVTVFIACLAVLAPTGFVNAADQASFWRRFEKAANNRRFVMGSDTSSGNCTFEVDTCFWSNALSDSFNWIRFKGWTATSSTGPSADHTLGNDTGYYMYIEASAPHKAGDNAILQSVMLPAYSPLCLQFYYNMYGASIGTLRVWVEPQGASRTRVWELSGNQGDGWHQATVPMSQSKPFQVFFDGIRGQSYRGDIAIDDVAFTGQTCAVTPNVADPGQGSAVTTIATLTNYTVGTSLPPTNNTWECTFEAQPCIWTNAAQDNFDWTLNRGATTSSDTGPTVDHTYADSSGHYMYIESSSRTAGDYAILQSNILPSSAPSCLQFYYHMYGDNIGSLSVWVQPRGAAMKKVWQLDGNQGNTWKHGAVSVGQATEFQVFIKGVVGNGYRGDIAIDDVIFTPGLCHLAPTHADSFLAATTTITTPQSPFAVTTMPQSSCPCDCTFEVGTCFWVNAKQDMFDWGRGEGYTLSALTGPNGDHTFGNLNGHFMYIEASAPRTAGDNAILQSPFLSTSSPTCLQFYYNMYGSDVGTLRVMIQSQASAATMLWVKTGNEGAYWKLGTVTIPADSQFRVMFEAVVGQGYRGDIAIDDVSFTDNSCISTGDSEESFAAKTTTPDYVFTVPGSSVPNTTTGASIQPSNCPCSIMPHGNDLTSP